MSENCCVPGRNIMILACSGGSNVGQLSNQAAVELTQEGFGAMFCLAGIGGRLSGFVQSARDVEEMVAIDGCPIGCAKAVLEQAQVPLKAYLVITDLGIEKQKVFKLKPDDLQKVKEAVKEACNRWQAGFSGQPGSAVSSDRIDAPTAGRGQAGREEIIVIGTQPPCVRCETAARWAEEAAAELGLKVEVKKLELQDPKAQAVARSMNRELGTAKDVARKASLEVDWKRVQELASGPWSPELDESLTACKEKAEQVGMLMTPLLIVGGKLKHHGSVPSREQIRGWLEEEFGPRKCC
jgi:uncharacterized metal-binding protein